MKNFYKVGACIALVVLKESFLNNILKMFCRFIKPAKILYFKSQNIFFCSFKLKPFGSTDIVKFNYQNSLTTTCFITNKSEIYLHVDEYDKKKYNNILSASEMKSYAKHLLNEIYKPQEGLKFISEEFDFENVIKRKRLNVEKICNFFLLVLSLVSSLKYIMIYSKAKSYLEYLSNQIYQHQLKNTDIINKKEIVSRSEKRSKVTEVKELKGSCKKEGDKISFLNSIILSNLNFVLILSIFAFSSNVLIAQDVQNESIQLNIGDTIPMELWTAPLKYINSNNESKHMTLNDYKNHKLIILDFWASWCSSCLESIYKGNKLRKEFNDEIIIIPVNNAKFTRDNSDKILSSLKRISEKDFVPFTIVDNGTISNYFPHYSLPHLVWINSEGVIEASSHSIALNYSAIKELIVNNKNTILIKSDNLEFDKNKKIVEQFKIQNSDIINSSIFFSSYIEMLPIIAGNFYNNGDESIYRVCNYSLTYFINIAYREKYPSINRIKPYHYIFSKNFNPIIVDLIKSPNSNESKFTFEFSKKGNISREEVREELIKILSNKFKFTVSVSQKPTKVLIVEDGPEMNLHSLISSSENTYLSVDNDNNERIMQNYSLEFLVAHLGGRLEIPIINNSKYKEKFTFRFPRKFDFNNKDQVIKYLSDLGFKIYEDTKMYDYLKFSTI
ncbi:TlpA family protein disulfide reductase [Sphingobacterium bovistauri]|uniref:Redoxin domain-containing protein n=1 Tax=Sphingobacterium bovistauri TaxID=2781959 RepID=A0ABS7Z1L7_9SPHI|nr:redoxin domain-containing protein [Sphingobacterium bovistauri]MCA5004055.1 redoxin domain-containing protein [Sphingobacterium bovistauri]